MLNVLLAIVLWLIAAYIVLLLKSFEFMSPSELKRRARNGDEQAKRVYLSAHYTAELNILLWTLQSVAIILMLLKLGQLLSGVIFWPLAILLLVHMYEIVPRLTFLKPSLKLASQVGPLLEPILRKLHPALRKIGILYSAFLITQKKKSIHSREELLEIIEEEQKDYDIDDYEKTLIKNALSFSDKKIMDYMTPLSVVKALNSHDIIGVKLLNELHQSGFSRFPVYGKDTTNIIGTLYYKDVAMHAEGKTVGQMMSKEVYFVNENTSIEHALNAFLRTQHHLFVVVNSFEEMVGVITIEDVIEQIIGHRIVDEFDQYSDLRAVAAQQAKKSRAERKTITEAEVDNQSEKPQEEVLS